MPQLICYVPTYFASTMYFQANLKYYVKNSKLVTLFYALAMEVMYGIKPVIPVLLVSGFQRTELILLHTFQANEIIVADSFAGKRLWKGGGEGGTHRRVEGEVESRR